jgi:hypothetical protein
MKDLEGSGRSLIDVLFQHLPGGTTKKLSHLMIKTKAKKENLPRFGNG